MSRVVECTDDEFFRRTLDSTKRFVVDFTATWCGPCRTMAPIFDQLSMKHTFITFLKIDIDKCPNTAAKFGIRSVPSFLFLEGTKQLDSMGGVDPEQLDRKCAEYGKPVKGEAVFHEVFCSLEELFLGGLQKKVKISRQRRQMDGEFYNQEKVLEIPIKAGWKAGTKLTYAGEGDEEPNKIPSDIIFVIKEKPHEHFTRDGNNLIFAFDVPMKEALINGIAREVPLLEGGCHNFALSEPAFMTSDHRLSGMGMPISKTPGTRGDLIIRPKICLPQKSFISTLPRQDRETLIQILN